jgi:hypothetical protein
MAEENVHCLVELLPGRGVVAGESVACCWCVRGPRHREPGANANGVDGGRDGRLGGPTGEARAAAGVGWLERPASRRCVGWGDRARCYRAAMYSVRKSRTRHLRNRQLKGTAILGATRGI